jgi:hypothetical protein
LKQAAADGSITRLSLVERYALYVARHASNAWWSLVLLAFAGVFALIAVFRGAAVAWPIVVTFVFLALLYWERSGFRRLLARQQQPDHFSSHEDSA